MTKEDLFLQSSHYGVAGASSNRAKYGNKVVRAYQQRGLPVYPINPKMNSIEGAYAYISVEELPVEVDALSIVTPPAVTMEIVKSALQKGIRNLWMQPGAENLQAVKLAEDAGANVIYGGPCILVQLGYRE